MSRAPIWLEELWSEGPAWCKASACSILSASEIRGTTKKKRGEKKGGASRWQKSKVWRSPSSWQICQKYIYKWNNSYRTLTERWQKTSDLPKGKKLPTYLGRAKEKRKKQRQKNTDGTCTSGRELWRRKGFHTLGSPFTDGDCGWQMGEASEPWTRVQQQGCGGQSREIPAQSTNTQQPERLVCSPAGTGGGWELRLGLQRSDPRERTGVGCMNTAWRG